MAVEIDQPIVLDLLDTTGTPALSSTSDMPVVETKPDAQNQGAPPEASAAASDEEAKTDSESATEPETEPSASDAPPKAKGVQKRLDELTRQREDEKRRAEAAEARLDRVLATLERQAGIQKAQPGEAAPEEDPEPQRPSRHAIADPQAYEDALLDYAEQRAQWIARKEVRTATAEAEQRLNQSAAEQEQQAAHAAYRARVDEAKAKIADFDEVAHSPDVQVSIPMAAAILQSENGPLLQYHLGKNPQEAQRIRALAPPLQLLELGKLEARLTAPPAPKPAVSAAPAPIKPLTGAQAPQKSPEDMSMDEYAAYRRAQLRTERGVRH